MANDYDPDGDGLTFSLVSSPSHGTLYFDYGIVTDRPWYSPEPGYAGTDSLTYQICDPFNACATGAVTIHIVNQSPIAENDEYTVHGPGYIGYFSANDHDPDGDGLTFSLVSPPSHGTLLFDYGVPTPRPWYTPTLGYAGTDSLTYQMCDRFNACATAEVTI